MLKKVHVAALAGLVVAAGAVCGLLLRENHALRQARDAALAKANMFDAHCRSLRSVLESEVADLAAEQDASKQTRMTDRLFDQLSSPSSGVAGCVKTAPDGPRLSTCWINHDVKCMTGLATAAISQLPKP